jgi:uncharacterized protein
LKEADSHRVNRAGRSFSVLENTFAICRLPANTPLPEWCVGDGFFSITHTPDELSIVCPQDRVPLDVPAERGWKCFRLQGPIPFSETGVLASFVQPLSDRAIPVFAISTYDTDYVLIKNGWDKMALDALLKGGYKLTAHGASSNVSKLASGSSNSG